MNAERALAFVREHGIVLASANGPVPRLTDAIVGESVKGSWWAHPDSHRIFAIFEGVEGSADILVCRLVDDKITFVHRRLWPALVRVAERFPANRLAQVQQEHTAAGHHVSHDIAFPQWVPADVVKEAQSLSEPEALGALGSWVMLPAKRTARTPRKRGPRGG